MLYRFDKKELDLNAIELRCDGKVIPIPKKAFELLYYLIKNSDRVVSRQELMDKIWNDDRVNESIVPCYVSVLRKSLNQKSSENSPIGTVRGRGYHFKSKVEIIEGDPSDGEYYLSRLANDSTEPFVGRKDVIERLTEAALKIKAGRGKILLLRGGIGIGKTRCAAEFSNEIIRLGLSLWTGRCSETPGQVAFWPWIQILRDSTSSLSKNVSLERESMRLLSLLNPRSPENVVSHPVIAELSATDRFYLYDSLHSFLQASCISEPRILVIDDIHWADEASLEFLRFLAPDVAGQKILILITMRDEMENSNPSAQIEHLGRYMDEIPLSSLSEEDVDRYISASGIFRRDEEFSRAFYIKTSGNPLFMHQALQWLLSSFSNSDKKFTAADLEFLGFPTPIKELMRRRLSTIDQQTVKVLGAASVIGRNFDLRLVSQILACDLPTIITSLYQAISTGLIVKESMTSFHFRHDFICQVTYEDLPEVTRTDYHHRIANALLNKPEIDAVAHTIAFHLYRALPVSDINTTIAWIKMAASLSSRMYAYGSAAIYYGWALQAIKLTDSFDPRVQAELLCAQSYQQRYAGNLMDSVNTGHKALEIARSNGYFDIVADIALLNRSTLLKAYIPEPRMREALEEAIVQIPEKDKALRIRLLSQLALIPPYSIEMSRCQETCREAIKLAEESGDTESMRTALSAALYSLSAPDDNQALLKTTQQILDLEKDGGRVLPSTEALLARIIGNIHIGDLSEANRAIEDYGRLVEKLQNTEGMWTYQRFLAQSDYHQGRFDRAIQSFEEVRQRGKRIGIFYSNYCYRTQMMNLKRYQEGLSDLILNSGKTILDIYRTLPNSQATVVGLFAEAGFPELVKKDYETLTKQEFQDIPRNFLWLQTITSLSLAAVAFNDEPRIQKLYALLKPYSIYNTLDGIFLSEGSVAYFLGILASKLNKDRDTIQYFNQAIEANRSMQMFPRMVLSQIVLAEWLMARGGRKYQAEIKTLASEALNGAREMGLDSLLKRVEKLSGKAR